MGIETGDSMPIEPGGNLTNNVRAMVINFIE